MFKDLYIVYFAAAVLVLYFGFFSENAILTNPHTMNIEVTNCKGDEKCMEEATRKLEILRGK